MSKKQILITGGVGYIGSHAVIAFEQAGYETVIIDNFINSSELGLQGIKKILGYQPDFFLVDIRDREKMSSIFQQYKFDGVIHFAGLKSPFQSQKSPLEYHDNNVRGSMELFALMQQHKVNKMVFSSSAAVYDSENISPCKENDKLGSQHPYATTKLVLEYLLRDLSLNSDLKTIALRYFNPVGAHESGYIGERPNGIPNNLFPYVFDVAIGKREKVFVYGNNYPTIDGTGVRDYIDVNDLAEAHLAAYRHLDSMEPNFDVFNVGTGMGTSVLQGIRMVEQESGINIPYEITDPRRGDLAEVYADVSKAKQLIGWSTKRTVQDGIRSSWKFVTMNRNV